MKVIITKNKEAMGKRAAKIIAALIKRKPNCVLGVGTGSTQIPVYKHLVRMHRKGKLDFSRVTTFNVDDYYGLNPDSKSSHTYYMRKHLFNKVNLKPKNAHLPGRNAKAYEDKIKKASGIDLQFFGIGRDGHIGYNEPGSKLNSKSRIVKLDGRTRIDNAKYFGHSIKKVPKYGITLGIKAILKSKKILLTANGPKKADAIAKAIEGKPSSDTPASFLQKHKNTIFIIDKSAARKLKKKH